MSYSAPRRGILTGVCVFVEEKRLDFSRCCSRLCCGKVFGASYLERATVAVVSSAWGVLFSFNERFKVVEAGEEFFCVEYGSLCSSECTGAYFMAFHEECREE